MQMMHLTRCIAHPYLWEKYKSYWETGNIYKCCFVRWFENNTCWVYACKCSSCARSISWTPAWNVYSSYSPGDLGQFRWYHRPLSLPGIEEDEGTWMENNIRTSSRRCLMWHSVKEQIVFVSHQIPVIWNTWLHGKAFLLVFMYLQYLHVK